MSYRLNPLLHQAAENRHTKCCQNRYCLRCDAKVSTYNCNDPVVAVRPDAAGWDWWAACDNADCENAFGEGEFQEMPEWIEVRK